ncbi:hypothetical protein BDN67DRAFT_1065242 [Paxillus ammoniavirescens]|nr:hypothetical protein BDN67DRAFT_1065242 [Paxillus ammoniavirescens]
MLGWFTQDQGISAWITLAIGISIFSYPEVYPLPQNLIKARGPPHHSFAPKDPSSLIMFAAKSYIALLLVCLLQVSLALPIAEFAAREPTKGPVADQFGGGGGGGPPDCVHPPVLYHGSMALVLLSRTLQNQGVPTSYVIDHPRLVDRMKPYTVISTALITFLLLSHNL